MRTFLLLPAVCLAFSVTILAKSPPPDVTHRLTGNWRLLSFENFDDKGAARPGGYSAGRLMYDAHGNMAAQLTRQGRKPLASTQPTPSGPKPTPASSPITAATPSTSRKAS